MKTPSLRAAALVLAAVSLAVAQPAAPPDHFFDSNGVRIRYVEHGTGEPVVMLHGYTGTLDRHFVANGVFANIAKDHRAIAMDLRAHGRSGKPHDPQAYGDELARHAIRLLDHLKISRAHIVGYSLGAILAGRLIVTDPDRLLSVAFIGAHPRRELNAIDRQFIAESIKDLEGDVPFRSLAVALQAPGTPMPSDAELRNMVAPLVAANDVKALAAMWRGGAFPLTTDAALEAAKFPMIEIIGTLDPSVSEVPQLQKAHPQITMLVLEGATHGGEQGVLRRPETLPALRAVWAKAR
jgi:pimeloyl-ACP methyl ester carboxylesterase